MKKFSSHKRGAAVIIMVFFFIAISLAIVQSATVGAISELRTYRSVATSKFAYVAAEAGIEDIFYRTIRGKILPTSETITLNNSTATVNVVTLSPTEIDIYSTGNASDRIRKLFLKTTKSAGNVQFNYGAQIGTGGITMGNNVTVDGTGSANGDIYSDGPITGAPGVLITGNAISAAEILPDNASSTVCISDEAVGNTNPAIDFAQSFVISTSTAQPLAKVSLYIKRTNSSPANATIHITEDNAGVPASTALASQILTAASAGSTYGWVDIIFAAPATLNPSTNYWIVFDSTQHSTKFWTWCRNNTVTSSYKTTNWSAPSWAALSGTLNYKITLGRGGSSEIEDVTVQGTAKADEIEGSVITGNAYYQVISGTTVGGTACPNVKCYPGSPTPPYVPLPFSSTTIAQWKTDAAAGGTITGNCGTGGVAGCNTFPLSIGPRKIIGNLLVTTNGVSLTLTGTVHVTGNVDLANNSTIKCAPAFGASSCMLIADGYINVNNGVIFGGSNTTGSFIMLLSTKKDCNGVTGSTGCTTNNSAISLGNNTDGALFYTTDSMIEIANGVEVTAVIGYKLNLAPNAKIIYDPLVSNLTFIPDSSVAPTIWSATNWSELR